MIGLEIDGAAFFLHEPTEEGFSSPTTLNQTTARIEVFVNEPDRVIDAAIAAGASVAQGVRDYRATSGFHQRGSFIDRFGHVWHVGDRSPLQHWVE